MAKRFAYAKDDRRLVKDRAGERVDIPFLVILLLLLAVGLVCNSDSVSWFDNPVSVGVCRHPFF